MISPLLCVLLVWVETIKQRIRTLPLGVSHVSENVISG
jgi:hypothetical protein